MYQPCIRNLALSSRGYVAENVMNLLPVIGEHHVRFTSAISCQSCSKKFHFLPCGTRDYRALAGILFFAFPLCNNFVLVMEVILHDNYNINIFFLYFTSLLSLLVSFMRPLKSTIANMSVIFCFIMLEFLLICAYLMHFIQVEKSFL